MEDTATFQVPDVCACLRLPSLKETVDARGFNELLVNSRGVIVNMINQAVNEKGRMAIV